jgi:hypothetical protein
MPRSLPRRHQKRLHLYQYQYPEQHRSRRHLAVAQKTRATEHQLMSLVRSRHPGGSLQRDLLLIQSTMAMRPTCLVLVIPQKAMTIRRNGKIMKSSPTGRRAYLPDKSPCLVLREAKMYITISLNQESKALRKNKKRRRKRTTRM